MGVDLQFVLFAWDLQENVARGINCNGEIGNFLFRLNTWIKKL